MASSWNFIASLTASGPMAPFGHSREGKKSRGDNGKVSV